LKRLHRFIIRSFIGPFLVTFAIAMFFLIMQFLWKYIDDLMGKGLELSIILEMLFYVSASLIPLALPIAILFSSIMTFGNLAENNELTALKSAGISLTKVMRPMLIFVFILSLSAFYFTNYILPIANLKWHAIYWDILDTKPEFMLKEGIFYKEIEGYQIKVDKKNDDEGNLTGVLIYDFTNNGDRRIIRAKQGQMLRSDNKNYMFLQLISGVIYEKVPGKKFDKINVDFQKSFFKDAVIKFNMSGFDLEKSNEEMYKQDFEMMNFVQLDLALDSLEKLNDTLDLQFSESLHNKVLVLNDKFISEPTFADSLQVNQSQQTKIDTIISLDSLHSSELISAKMDAQNEIRNTKEMIYHQTLLEEQREYSLNEYRVAWHKKFTLSFAIVILFFIGAPLGAIIKKGGLGAPLVFATLFFILYYILTIAGENMVDSDVMVPWKGLWLSSFILAPLGAFLTYKAVNDSALFDRDVYKRWFNRILNKRK
jgi:lipopolysaccharide export system permease protein